MIGKKKNNVWQYTLVRRVQVEGNMGANQQMNLGQKNFGGKVGLKDYNESRERVVPPAARPRGPPPNPDCVSSLGLNLTAEAHRRDAPHSDTTPRRPQPTTEALFCLGLSTCRKSWVLVCLEWTIPSNPLLWSTRQICPVCPLPCIWLVRIAVFSSIPLSIVRYPDLLHGKFFVDG